MTLTLIQCAVKAANQAHFSYTQTLDKVIYVVEMLTGYEEGNQFSIREIQEEMKKYDWN